MGAISDRMSMSESAPPPVPPVRTSTAKTSVARPWESYGYLQLGGCDGPTLSLRPPPVSPSATSRASGDIATSHKDENTGTT